MGNSILYTKNEEILEKSRESSWLLNIDDIKLSNKLRSISKPKSINKSILEMRN